MNEKFCFGLAIVMVFVYLLTIVFAGGFGGFDISFALQSAAWCFGVPIAFILLAYIYMGFDAAYQQREALRQEGK